MTENPEQDNINTHTSKTDQKVGVSSNKEELSSNNDAKSPEIPSTSVNQEVSSEEQPVDPKSETNEKGKPKKKKERLQKKLEKKDKELKEQQEKYEFLNAELENTRKHFLKQKKIDSFRSENKVLTKFAPLIDSFESALESIEKVKQDQQSEQVDLLITGVEQIYDQLKNIFDFYGLHTINEAEIPFNYNIHEVMMRMVNDNIPEDTVIQILQRGYERDGHVIRPAKVIVSQHTPPPPPPPKPEEEKKEEVTFINTDDSSQPTEIPSEKSEVKTDEKNKTT